MLRGFRGTPGAGVCFRSFTSLCVSDRQGMRGTLVTLQCLC